MFADAATSRRAIAGTGHPLAKEELASAPDDMDQVMTDATLDPAAHIPFLWHKGRDFLKQDAKGKETKVSSSSAGGGGGNRTVLTEHLMCVKCVAAAAAAACFCSSGQSHVPAEWRCGYYHYGNADWHNTSE